MKKLIAAALFVTAPFVGIGTAGAATGNDAPSFTAPGVVSPGLHGSVNTATVRGSQAASVTQSLKAAPLPVTRLCTDSDTKSPNPAKDKAWPCSGVLKPSVSTTPGA